jgi:hypothetical protein
LSDDDEFVEADAESTTKMFLEISYFTVVRIVCLSDSEVIDLLENCFENEDFEFSVIFAECVENADL